MKKFLVTILALVYLTSTVGAMVRLDCCLEKLLHVTLATTHAEEWSSELNSDCKDDHKQVRLGHEQKRSDNHVRVAKALPASINTAFPEYSFHAVAALTEEYPVNNAPPQKAIVPLFILNCVHRI